MNEVIHLKYLAASDTDLSWGSAVNAVGCQQIEAGEAYPPYEEPTRYLFSAENGRTLHEYQLVYIESGKGSFRSETPGRKKAVQVEAGDMLVLFPGEWHNYSPDKKTGWKEYWIGFQGEFFASRVKEGFFSKEDPVLHIGQNEEIVELYTKAMAVAREQRTGFQQKLSGLLEGIISEAYFQNRNNSFKVASIPEKIARAKQIISEEYSTIDSQSIASELCMSYSNFRKIFKQYTGFSPAQYIQDIRMNKVKEILTNTDLLVKTISEMQGFDNYEYFLTAFKANTGITPSEYRELTKGENAVMADYTELD